MVSAGKKVIDRFFFFGKEVREVDFSCYVFNCDKTFFYLFSCSIFTYLNVTESFGGEILCPTNASVVIVVDDGWRVHDFILDTHAVDDVCEVL